MKDNLTGLGRRVEHDPRSRGYAIPFRAAPKKVRQRYWWSRIVLDQGNTPQCVAYSGIGWLMAGPCVNMHIPFTPRQLYDWARKLDEWPGEDYDGTSALGLMKALKERGYVTEYRWAFDVETIYHWLLTEGPLLFGSNWYEQMFDTDARGFIEVAGRNYGGHEYVLIGANRDKICPDGSVGAVRLVNSWGHGWGDNGRAWLSYKDLERLVGEEADCVTATEIDLD